MANRSPPMPLPVGSISPSAALAAIAASTALPPWRIVSSAIWVASGCEVAAMASGAITSDRVAKGRPVMRSAPCASPASSTVEAIRAAGMTFIGRLRSMDWAKIAQSPPAPCEGTVMRTLVLSLSLLMLAACGREPAPAATVEAPAADPAAVAAELDALLAEWHESELKANPIFATALGDLRYNDQLPDFMSAEYRAENEARERDFLARVQKLDREALTGQHRLSRDVFVSDRELSLEGNQFPGWMLPVHQFGNYGSFFAQLGSGQGIQPFREVKNYDD